MADTASDLKTLLVTGATGNQGKSPNITLLAGDLDNCDAIFASAPAKIDAVYSVQVNVFGGPEKTRQEEILARNLIESSLAHNVKHFVQSSGDRGGYARSAVDPTPVPVFQTKFHIEQHLISRAAENGMTWTILRPVTFMENLSEDFQGKGFATMWNDIGEKPLQLVATRDIGIFASKALLHPENPIWKNKAVGIVGDELTQVQASEIFKKVTGKSMPIAHCLVGNLVQWKVPEIKAMFLWFKEKGCAASVNECRSIHPEMLNLEGWLRETGRC
ncbi:uncharacterized protein KY384_005473 [Bacidia gigantensis]|uniref:uncharacterized protein n=1 Tax=Bacidia gigantensis TaxID=2732470 RepID=UPI001D04CFB5|nr:uncharacterized protein KY384_005473 [Bacidia gigantensis]KAG8529991.1 hypothetical protein KY384_005473 [Bacidia gigantensis]